MKVVITGGTGMLGRRLALRLLAAPDDQGELVGPSGRTEDDTNPAGRTTGTAEVGSPAVT